MDVFGFLGGIIKPVTDVIDQIHTSEEEKLKLRNELVRVQNDLGLKVLDYEKRHLEAQAEIIKAEAQGQSWMQRNWRPITMLTFLTLVVLDSFGMLKFRLASQAWTLLQIGLGGYVVGRSAEKIIPDVARIINKE
ncbi:MAG: 3TM-type holin [Candidatus Margulisiibacteriota bacterium]